jgi:hypothetical protein
MTVPIPATEEFEACDLLLFQPPTGSKTILQKSEGDHDGDRFFKKVFATETTKRTRTRFAQHSMARSVQARAMHADRTAQPLGEEARSIAAGSWSYSIADGTFACDYSSARCTAF